MLSAGYNSI